MRELPLAPVSQLIDDHTDGRFLGVLGEPGVNVLELNLALDRGASDADGRPLAARRSPSCATPSCVPRKLDPRVQVRNPVMFVVEIGA